MEKAASNQKVAVSLNLEKGTDMLRKSGIEVVGDVPWGTHFCLFYETKEDLIDILVPYFKVGLENNEFCMWVTSEHLTEEESKNAMRKVVPNFDRYLKRGQMEIVPHSKWYLKDGSFNMQRVLDSWIDKLNQALDKGYDGIRVTGNTAWLEKRDWKNFTDYEEKVNSVIGKYRMMAICTYSLARCGALEVVDVISNHQFALIRREGEWEIIESSERKQTEEALRESEEKFKNIFENANDTMIFLDIYGRILDANKKAVEVFGGSKEELLGKHFTKVCVFSPRDTPRVLSAFAKVLAGKIGTLTVSIRNKRGKEMALECSGSATKIGDKLAVLVIGRDITERKRMEEALRQSQEKYRNIVELAPDGIMTVNTKGFITSINPAFSTLTGYSKDEIVGKHFTKLPTIQMKDILKFVKLSRSFFRGKTIPLVEFVYRRKDGTIAWGEAHPSLMKEDGKIIGAQAILRDITERKQMEEKLRQYSEHLEELVQKRTEELLESEKRYSVLVEEASDGVVILQDERIAFTNKKGAELIGYSKDELLGVPFEKLVSEKHRLIVEKRYEKRLRGEKLPEALEIELIAKTGEYVPIELTGALVRSQGRPADLIIIRDIRERKRMEEQRSRIEKLATMGELATMVAHDLRNPLTSIRNAGYYIKNTCPYRTNTECKTTLEMLNIIEQETIFANNIINDLLDFAAKRPLQKKRQNINEIIEDSLTKGNIPRNIEVKRNFKKAIIGVDEKQLERVFLNLIKNAVQAMPHGGKLAVTTKETKDNVEIIFADTGVGISEENISKLFTPLFTTKAKGIGMGLAICKNIVEQHNGTIEVKSKPGQGTTFTIKLPKKEEANNQ